MELPKFAFIQPHSLQEACFILRENDRKAALLAGGTSLMVDLRYKLSKPQFASEKVLKTLKEK